MTHKEEIKQVVAELNKCLPNAKKQRLGYKVRVSGRCITIVGKCHVEDLEDVTSDALDKYYSFGNDNMQHTQQHNIRLHF